MNLYLIQAVPWNFTDTKVPYLEVSCQPRAVRIRL